MHGDAIDQIFVSPALEALLVGEGTGGRVDIVHANVEFFENASDHDPVLIRFAP